MNTIQNTSIPGLKTIQPKVFRDNRGHFFEAHSEKLFEREGLGKRMVQTNVSKSKKNVIRGLHLQKHPHGQEKLVQCINGAIFDVAVDVRLNSPTFGQWYGVILSSSNNRQLLIPDGFAHGFQTLEENTVVHYQCSNFYEPASEISIRWDDPQINIDWLWQAKPIVSEKDQQALTLSEYEEALS